MTIEDLAREFAEVRGEVPKDLGKRLIAVRAELFQRGVFDPVLARFDTVTVPRASPAEIAEELKLLAAAPVALL